MILQKDSFIVSIPRLRIFAGPNGSGKSTLKSVISDELLEFILILMRLKKKLMKKNFFRFRILSNINKRRVNNFFYKSSFINQKQI